MEGVNEDEVRPIKATDKVGGSLLSEQICLESYLLQEV